MFNIHKKFPHYASHYPSISSFPVENIPLPQLFLYRYRFFFLRHKCNRKSRRKREQWASNFTSTEKSFRNLIKSNQNQIVFTMHRLIRNTNGHCPFAVPNQPRKMVNTIWLQFNLIRFKRKFSVCTYTQIFSNCVLNIPRPKRNSASENFETRSKRRLKSP